MDEKSEHQAASRPIEELSHDLLDLLLSVLKLGVFFVLGNCVVGCLWAGKVGCTSSEILLRDEPKPNLVMMGDPNAASPYGNLLVVLL